MKKVVVFGATSAIIQAVARLLAAEGASFFLVARNPAKLASVAADLRVRGATAVHEADLDLNDVNSHQALIADAFAQLAGVDLVLVAHGLLGAQARAEVEFAHASELIFTNYLSIVSLLTHLIPRLEAQQRGQVAVLSSVAGDRGRASNYVYGSAKGALTLYLSGLRARLSRTPINILTLKLGFVDTPMTAGCKKGPLWATPAALAPRILAAIAARRDQCYLPGFWAIIMTIVKLLPEPIFKKLRF